MTSLSLTWWEYDEAIEHMLERDDIWTRSEENDFLWLRSQTLWAEDGTCRSVSGLAVQFIPPVDASSPYRMFSVQMHVMDWDPDYCKTYFTSFFKHWTTYGERMRIAHFLHTELGLPEDHSSLGAIGLTAMEHDIVDPDPENVPHTVQALLPDLTGVVVEQRKDPSHLGTWLLRDGGYVSLHLTHEMLAVSISILSSHKQGYGPPLRGFVRPPSGNIHAYAEMILGKAESHEEADSYQPVLVEGLHGVSQALVLEETPESGDTGTS
jgi:hypothetical protein